jgi:hypothetical protein
VTLTLLVSPAFDGIGCGGIGVPARLGPKPTCAHPPPIAPPHPAMNDANNKSVKSLFIAAAPD